MSLSVISERVGITEVYGVRLLENVSLVGFDDYIFAQSVGRFCDYLHFDGVSPVAHYQSDRALVDEKNENG